MNEKNTQEISLIAYCGLYCGECFKFKNGKCLACQKNEGLSWCKIRKCCIENQFENCSECNIHQSVNECRLYRNLISKTIEFFTQTDRSLCVRMIREKGADDFMRHMNENNKMSLSKKSE